MGIKGVPFGYLEFSRAIGGNHAHTRAPPPPAAARPQGSGHGPGPGCRLGSNPARFFLNRATRVWCYKQVSTRSATCPLRCNCWKERCSGSYLERTVGTNSCNSSDRIVATSRTPKDHYALQTVALLSVDYKHTESLQTVPRSAINSAPLRGLQTH